MANTISKNHSFGEVLDALKLKGVKACRECWLNNGEFKEFDFYIYFNESDGEIIDCDGEYFVAETEDYFAEDWMIIYPN